MKLTVLQENLKNAVNLTSHFITPKAQLPLLGNILLKTSKSKLILSSTNLETSVSTSIGAKIEEEGEITIPGKTFSDLIQNLSTGQIEIEVDKEQIKISSGSFKSKLLGINSAEFPVVPNNLPEDSIKFSTKDLVEALNKTLFAVSNDETRPVLTGILFQFNKGGLKLVSTDGFRLSQKVLSQIENKKEKVVIIPRSILNEIVKITEEDEICFAFNEKDNQVIFGVGETVYSSRIIEGSFPDYERIIPASFSYKVNIDKEDFEKAIKLASVFARDAGNILKLIIMKDSIKVLAESSSAGNQETDVEARVETEIKEDLEISFNYKFIEDLLRSIKGDEVVIELGGSGSAAKFLDPVDKNFLHLIMPIKIQG